MRRRLFRMSTGLSIAALAAVLFLWLTSYYRYRIFSDQGRVLILVVKANDDTDYWLRVRPPTANVWENLLPEKSLRMAGVQLVPFRTINRYEFTYYNGPTKGSMSIKLPYALAALPYWLLALVAAVLPVVRLSTAIRRRTRRRQGRCAVCGYDLRHSPDRCPECGTAAAREPAPAPSTTPI